MIQNAKCWQNKAQETLKCIERCGKNLECGHKCLNECLKCPEHSTLQEGLMNEKKLPSICNFPVEDIILPICGHVFQNAKCWQNQVQETLKCMTKVTKKLSHCEHFKAFHVCNLFYTFT